MTPEGKVKAEIKDYLKSIGAYYFMPVQMGYGAPALDFYCCVDGKFVGIEAKRAEGGVLSKRQEMTMAAIQAAGGLAFVATSREDVEHGLRGLL